MATIDEQVLRAAKEIVVKFIETGRVSPTAFPETFGSIYRAVDETVKAAVAEPAQAAPDNQDAGDASPQKARGKQG